MGKELAARPTPVVGELVDFDLERELKRVVELTSAIQRIYKAVMKEGEHYGVIPGTDKRSLWQPGADKLCLLFRLRPEYDETSVEREDFVVVKVRCRLVHIITGVAWGEGMGSANSREDKYLKQASAKLCPACGRTGALLKSRDRPEWFCWVKKSGCGATFPETEPTIVSQIGQVNSDKVWNLHNTLLKMACKRARVAAVLTATGAADIFTQDLEDLEDLQDELAGGGGAAEGGQQAQSQPRQNGKPGAPAPAPAGKKRANMIQVRDINQALGAADIGAEHRLEWAGDMLGRHLNRWDDVMADEMEDLIKRAKAGEMPRVAGGAR